METLYKMGKRKIPKKISYFFKKNIYIHLRDLSLQTDKYNTGIDG